MIYVLSFAIASQSVWVLTALAHQRLCYWNQNQLNRQYLGILGSDLRSRVLVGDPSSLFWGLMRRKPGSCRFRGLKAHPQYLYRWFCSGCWQNGARNWPVRYRNSQGALHPQEYLRCRLQSEKRKMGHLDCLNGMVRQVVIQFVSKDLVCWFEVGWRGV